MAKKTLTQAAYDVDNIQNQADQVKGQATALKTAFDKTGSDAKIYNNSTQLVELQSETLNDSGAHAIGLNTADTVANNVADELALIRQAGSGTIPPDNSVTDPKLSDLPGQIKQAVRNSFSADADRYGINVVDVLACEESEETITVVSGAYSQSNAKIGLDTLTATGATAIIKATFASKDVSKFNGGQDILTSDYLTMPLTITGTLPTSITIEIASSVTDDTDEYEYVFTSLSAFDVYEVKISDMTVNGSPNLASIERIEVYATGGDGTTNIFLDKTQFVKKDPTLDAPNSFQYMGVAEFIQNSGKWLVVEEFGKNNIKCLEVPVGDPPIMLQGTKLYSNFILSSKMRTYDGIVAPIQSWGTDINNRISLYGLSGEAKLTVVEGGAIVVDESKTMAINNLDVISYCIKKQGSKVSAIIRNETTNEAVAFTTTTTLTQGYDLIGGFNIRLYDVIYSSITELSHAHHSDIAEVAKSSLDGANYDKDVDVTGSTITVSKGYDNQRIFFTMPSLVENATITMIINGISGTLKKYETDGTLVNAETVNGGLTEVYDDGVNFILAPKGGEKFAEGTSSGAAATTNTISGLTFRPKFISVVEVGNETAYNQHAGLVTFNDTEYLIADGGGNLAKVTALYDDGFDITFGNNVTNVYWAAHG